MSTRLIQGPANPVWIVDANGDQVFSGGLLMDVEATKTILRAPINVSGAGDNTLVVAHPTNRIKVLGLILMVSGDVDVRFENGAGGGALTGVMSLAADGNGFVLPVTMPGYHWFETSVNALLNLELSAAVQVSGCIVYYQEP